jgi:SAM-dependent methyltransferase
VTSDGRFDEVAKSYNAVVQEAIAASGETVGFFAELKVRIMAHALEGLDVKTFLDFGCGIGNTTRAIGARFSNAHVTGFDPSTESLAVARGATPIDAGGRITYSSSDDNALPLESESTDVAFTSCVFHHIEPREREHWARELLRVLRPGARLFLFEHNPFNPLTVRVVRSVPFDEGVVLLKPGEARGLLERAGFATSAPRFYFFFPRSLSALRRLEPALSRVPLGAQYFVIGKRPRDAHD